MEERLTSGNISKHTANYQNYVLTSSNTGILCRNLTPYRDRPLCHFIAAEKVLNDTFGSEKVMTMLQDFTRRL